MSQCLPASITHEGWLHFVRSRKDSFQEMLLHLALRSSDKAVVSVSYMAVHLEIQSFVLELTSSLAESPPFLFDINLHKRFIRA